MTNYEDYSYHKLRRLYRTVSNEERPKLAKLIINYYHKAIARSIHRQHPDWSVGQLKAGTFRRIYRNDFPPDELDRIATAMQVWHEKNEV